MLKWKAIPVPEFFGTSTRQISLSTVSQVRLCGNPCDLCALASNSRYFLLKSWHRELSQNNQTMLWMLTSAFQEASGFSLQLTEDISPALV